VCHCHLRDHICILFSVGIPVVIAHTISFAISSGICSDISVVVSVAFPLSCARAISIAVSNAIYVRLLPSNAPCHHHLSPQLSLMSGSSADKRASNFSHATGSWMLLQRQCQAQPYTGGRGSQSCLPNMIALPLTKFQGKARPQTQFLLPQAQFSHTRKGRRPPEQGPDLSTYVISKPLCTIPPKREISDSDCWDDFSPSPHRRALQTDRR